eukprot:Phypoly_transcript_08653.p1 GENE.Phypoly_transcript_08653~~Phypoly_transcript_08653.p1  ORF type:complete len:464 (+),score=41.17 Phypoly_transcript_08653:101-1492(+)
MVPSLLALCLSHIANNIERWSQHITEFHIKEAQYLVTDMTRLPQDVVCKILQELVLCKKLTLQNLVLFLDDQLQRIDFPSNLAIVNDATLKVIARLSKNLLSFKPGSCSKLNHADALLQFTKLQHLNLTNCKAVKLDDTLIKVFSQCQLVTLCLKNTSATNKSLSLIPTNSHSSLTDLDLCQTFVSPSCLCSIMFRCPLLERLHAEGCFEIDDSTFVEFTEEPNLALHELNLSICDIHDKSVAKIAARYPALRTLYLQGCPITDRSLKFIATLSDLQTLGLINCSYLTDQGVVHLANAKLPVTFLAVSNASKVGDKALEAISEGLVNISHLVLDQCINVGDRGIIAIAGKCLNLKLLSLVNCAKVTDAGITALTKNCTQLRHLTLNSVPITQTTITTLAKSGNANLSNLHLSMTSCNNIKLNEDLVRLCKRVESINLSLCAKVSRQDWQKLCTSAPKTKIIWS